MKILVLGYGNRGRSDDGVGWFVVDQVQKRALPEVETLALHQLEVDLAETLSHFDAVIFVDAAIPQDPAIVARKVVTPHWEAHAVAHYLTPSDLLAMAGMMYGAEPGGILFSIPAYHLDFGEALSRETEKAARSAVEEIVALVNTMRGGTDNGTRKDVIHA